MKNTLIEKLAIAVIIFVVISIVLSFIAYATIGVKLINNPEIIGEWFSKLSSGFDN